MKNLVLTSVAVLALAACAHHAPNQPVDSTASAATSITHEPPPQGPAPSTVEMHGLPGSDVGGTIVFQSEGAKIHVIAEFTNLAPNTDHGLHVHENGTCDGDKFAGAGAHFNPAKSAHGGPDSKKRHAGDLGNIHSDENGHAKLDIRIPSTPGVGTFGGKSVILHKGKDDMHSQPAGNSGDKIACGVVIQKVY